ncbi:hypothetical protein [Magnetospirillum sp. UT-4]|uniref:hypothetical protein n=1 Tax=Magnetospirillum sp. UT-4 TaxID=2681467 RepID=UPI001573336C|nr:hypothetical protein [Magnetospirillum sp. UT-4]
MTEGGRLVAINVELPAGILPHRLLYGTARFRQFLEVDLHAIRRYWDPELEPAQQVLALLEAYIGGYPLLFQRQYWPLKPHEDGIWELKTPDVRIFGWFRQKDLFIAVNGMDATEVKAGHYYGPFVREAVWHRQSLDLDGGIFVEGDDPDDVVSVPA